VIAKGVKTSGVDPSDGETQRVLFSSIAGNFFSRALRELFLALNVRTGVPRRRLAATTPVFLPRRSAEAF
jgi:hypothetical protein